MSLFGRLFGPPDEKSFAKAAIRALRDAGEEGPIEYDENEFALRMGEGEIAFLGNFYAMYRQADRPQRKEILAHFASVRLMEHPEIPDTFEAARESLLPVVRSHAYYEFSNLRLQNDGADFRIDPVSSIGEHLAVGLVVDFPDTTTALPAKQLEDWQIGSEVALEAALENLRRRSHPRGLQKVAEGLYLSAWEDSYDAARLLMPDIFIHLHVVGDPVIMVPTRDLVIVTGAEDTEGLAGMAAIAQDLLEAPYSVSLKPLRLDGMRWRDWELPTDHELANAFKRLAVIQDDRDYGEQKGLLEERHRRTGHDAFTATFIGTEDRVTGVVSSFCTWSNSGTQYLPVTDYIAFARIVDEQAETLGTATWEDAMKTFPDRLTMVDGYPRRYRVDDLPPLELIQKIVVPDE